MTFTPIFQPIIKPAPDMRPKAKYYCPHCHVVAWRVWPDTSINFCNVCQNIMTPMPEPIPQHAIIEYLTLALNIERLNYKLGALRIEIPELTSGDALFTALRWMLIEESQHQAAFDQWRELIESIANTPDYDTKAAATWFVTWCRNELAIKESEPLCAIKDEWRELQKHARQTRRVMEDAALTEMERDFWQAERKAMADALTEARDLNEYLTGSRNWFVPRIKGQVQYIINILSR